MCVLVLTAACTGPQQPPEPVMSAEARSYLTAVLDLMEKNSLHRRTIDWAEVRRDAFSQAGGARTTADTYGAIHGAVLALGDRHSRFVEPVQAADITTPGKAIATPEGRSLDDRVGYLSLPALRGPDEAYQRYVRAGRAAVAKAGGPRACGWVVDLRENTGGASWPMLAVVGPVLGDGTVGMFIDADGRRIPWTIERGGPRSGGHDFGWGDAPSAGDGRAPVAVLTDRATASAGEAVAVAFRGRPDTRSFGERTMGVPTGNVTYPLSDKALLVLTQVRSADRTGRAYDGPIAPDEEFVIPQDGQPDGEDRALEAARSWLLDRPACR
ncbi:S41 family peptidase [Streptomyces sp. NPDC093595]|uniref:S41 family peptidase n=1 Tax=Streptomyces sp. NPDC093595 TaxID=3366045 RepID=UPI00380E1A19